MALSDRTSAATQVPIATTLKKLDVAEIRGNVQPGSRDVRGRQATRQGAAGMGAALRDQALPVTMNLRCQSEDRKKFGGLIDPGDISKSLADRAVPLWVHCRPAKVFQTTDGGKGKAPAHGAGVREARVWVNPKSDASYRGGCPKELRFGGSIKYTAGTGCRDGHPLSLSDPRQRNVGGLYDEHDRLGHQASALVATNFRWRGLAPESVAAAGARRQARDRRMGQAGNPGRQQHRSGGSGGLLVVL